MAARHIWRRLRRSSSHHLCTCPPLYGGWLPTNAQSAAHFLEGGDCLQISNHLLDLSWKNGTARKLSFYTGLIGIPHLGHAWEEGKQRMGSGGGLECRHWINNGVFQTQESYKSPGFAGESLERCDERLNYFNCIQPNHRLCFATRQKGSIGRTRFRLSSEPFMKGFSSSNPSELGPKLVRYLSTGKDRSQGELDGIQENFRDELGGLEGVLKDVSDTTTVGGVTGNFGSSVSEVAAATVDCSYPTALLQLLIENVHLHAGLPWWGAIAVTTLAIRIICLPVVVYQMKAMARLSLMRTELVSITDQMRDSGYEPQVVQDGQQRIKELFKRYQTTPLSPFFGSMLQAPVFICFFFGIRNMAERVESLKEGGALWFTDLSTADSTFIFPLLTALTFWVNVELNAVDGMEGNPMAVKMKSFFRTIAALLVPLTASFEKALFCYWLTTNLFSLCQATVLKHRSVKDALGIPDTSHLVRQQTAAIDPYAFVSQQQRTVSRMTSSSDSSEEKNGSGKAS